MKYLFIIPIVLIMFSCSSSTKKKYYKNGQLKYAESIENGLIEGLAKDYYENGEIKRQSEYKHGKLNGQSLKYYPNHKIEWERNYLNDSLSGEYKDYFESGLLQNETFFENGLTNGTAKEYYENGKVKSVYTFIKGKKEGLSEVYYSSGKLNAKMLWKNNEQGKITFFDGNGNLLPKRKKIIIEGDTIINHNDIKHLISVGGIKDKLVTATIKIFLSDTSKSIEVFFGNLDDKYFFNSEKIVAIDTIINGIGYFKTSFSCKIDKHSFNGFIREYTKDKFIEFYPFHFNITVK